MDPFAFEPEQGLHVQCINNANYCYLREVDTLARTLAGSKAIGGFDSAHAVRAIHEAGWEGFQYNSARDGAELTDLFGACLYLAGLPFETDHKGVYEAVADSLEDTEHEGLQLMNKVCVYKDCFSIYWQQLLSQAAITL